MILYARFRRFWHCLWYTFTFNHRAVTGDDVREGPGRVWYKVTTVVACSCGKVFYDEDEQKKKKEGQSDN